MSSFKINDFPPEIKVLFFSNLQSIEDLANFGTTDRSFHSLSKVNSIWFNFAKLIDCPIPNPPSHGFHDGEIFIITKKFIEKLQDHLDYSMSEYIEIFKRPIRSLQLLDLSIDRINEIQKELEILDICKIWMNLQALLLQKGYFLKVIILDSKKICDYTYVKTEFNKWLEENKEKLSYIKKLSFFNINLRSLPIEFCKLDKIQTLNLSYNHIVFLPDFSSLINLKQLNLTCNELTTLDESLFNLPRLEKLFLRENPLYNLKDLLKKLRAKNIKVDLDIIYERQRITDLNTKKLALLIFGYIGALLGFTYIIDRYS